MVTTLKGLLTQTESAVCMEATTAGHSRAVRHRPLSVLALTISRGDSDLVASDSESFRRQELFFALLNLLLIGALLALQLFSRLVRGRPAMSVVLVLAVGFVIQTAYLTWVYARALPISLPLRRVYTLWPLGFNTVLALVLTSLTIRGDTAYYALMLLPILEAAFRLGLGTTIAVVVFADFISFLGAYGLRFGEYIEAGAMAVIYTVMGVLVWLLVNNLREREAKFLRNLEELERTRERLLSEEKLAAVGRLSRAIAHEIRNPVAMIASSLATATRAGQDEAERKEMFAIAAKEAARLERLTTDFFSLRPPACSARFPCEPCRHAELRCRGGPRPCFECGRHHRRCHGRSSGVQLRRGANSASAVESGVERNRRLRPW
jgi:signal transduction histidine kinase